MLVRRAVAGGEAPGDEEDRDPAECHEQVDRSRIDPGESPGGNDDGRLWRDAPLRLDHRALLRGRPVAKVYPGSTRSSTGASMPGGAGARSNRRPDDTHTTP